MKIAFLVLVHKNENQTNRLIEHLAKDFDVFAHVDKRRGMDIINRNNVFVYRKFKTYWGSFNLIMASLFLLEEAHRKKYDRYILISGQDIPLMTNSKIKEFFSNNNSEYIACAKLPIAGIAGNGGFDRMTRYWPNSIARENSNILVKFIYAFEKRLCNVISRISPRAVDYEFFKGSQWINLTHNCATKILEYLEKDKKYIKRYRWTCCADEIFFHTIARGLDGIEIVNDNLRYIDWKSESEHPSTLGTEDYQRITQSGKLFARKFDPCVDSEIIDRIYKAIGE